MIDWVTGRFRITHDASALSDGRSIRTKFVDGQEFILYDIANRRSVRGSHDASITVRSVTDNTIEVSGNPAKFLQGHNVFGTNDLVYLVSKLFDRLFQIDELKLQPTADEYEAIQAGLYALTRVDVNEHFHFASAQLARSWLRAAGSSANMRYRGVGIFKEGTLYFTPKSRRYVPKIYFKYDEITGNKKGHRLPEDLLRVPELVQYASKSLRFELKILSTQLKDWELDRGCNWDASVSTMLIRKFFIDKLELSSNMSLDSQVLSKLPKRLLPVYALWEQGYDLRTFYSSSAFYRWRSKLLEHGIDISIVKNKDEVLPVVPMIRYLDASPMGVPDWAYEKGLVA